MAAIDRSPSLCLVVAWFAIILAGCSSSPPVESVTDNIIWNAPLRSLLDDARKAPVWSSPTEGTLQVRLDFDRRCEIAYGVPVPEGGWAGLDRLVKRAFLANLHRTINDITDISWRTILGNSKEECDTPEARIELDKVIEPFTIAAGNRRLHLNGKAELLGFDLLFKLTLKNTTNRSTDAMDRLAQNLVTFVDDALRSELEAVVRAIAETTNTHPRPPGQYPSCRNLMSIVPLGTPTIPPVVSTRPSAGQKVAFVSCGQNYFQTTVRLPEFEQWTIHNVPEISGWAQQAAFDIFSAPPVSSSFYSCASAAERSCATIMRRLADDADVDRFQVALGYQEVPPDKGIIRSPDFDPSLLMQCEHECRRLPQSKVKAEQCATACPGLVKSYLDADQIKFSYSTQNWFGEGPCSAWKAFDRHSGPFTNTP